MHYRQVLPAFITQLDPEMIPSCSAVRGLFAGRVNYRTTATASSFHPDRHALEKSVATKCLQVMWSVNAQPRETSKCCWIIDSVNHNQGKLSICAEVTLSSILSGTQMSENSSEDTAAPRLLFGGRSSTENRQMFFCVHFCSIWERLSRPFSKVNEGSSEEKAARLCSDIQQC